MLKNKQCPRAYHEKQNSSNLSLLTLHLTHFNHLWVSIILEVIPVTLNKLFILRL